MPRICVDMDEVLADNYPAFHRRAEAIYGRPIDPAEYAGRRIYDLEGLGEVRDVLHEKGHFRSLPVMADAVEVMRELYEEHELFIVTTAMEFRYSLLDKYEWLEEHFPFIHHRRIVFCGDKSIVHGDYMIDDKTKNLKGFNGKGLLYTAPANLNKTGYQRVDNWRDVRAYFKREKDIQIAQLG